MTSSCERYVDSIQYGKDQGDIWKFLQRLENQVNRIESKVQDIDSKVRDLQYDAGQRELELIDKIKDLIDDKLKDNNPKNPKWTDFIDELFGLIGGIAGAGALGKLVGGAAALLPFIALGGAGVASFIAGVNNLKINELRSQLDKIPLIQQKQDLLNGQILALRLSTAISIAQANQKIENLTTKTVEQITKTNNQVSEITGRIIEEIAETNTELNLTNEKISTINDSINQSNTNQININSRIADLNANDQNLLNLINNVSSPDLSNFENRLSILESDQNFLKDEINIIGSELDLKIDVDTPIPSIKDIENRLKNIETTQNSSNKELDIISGKLTDITPKIELTTDQLQNFNIDNLDNRITKLENGISLVQGQLNGGTINAGNINTGTLNTGKLISPEITQVKTEITEIKIINNEQTTKIEELEKMNDTQFNTLQNGLNNLKNTVDFNDNGIKDELITVGGVLAGIGATLLILKNNPSSSCRYTDPTPRINSHTTATSVASTSVITGQVQAVNSNVVAVQATTNTTLNTLTNWIGGAWTRYTRSFSRLYQNLGIDRALKVIDTILILHNASMLSNALFQTLGDTVDVTLQAFGIKWTDEAGNQLEFSQVIGKEIKSFIQDLIGAETYVNIVNSWTSFNRIYQTGANLLYGIRGLIDEAADLSAMVAEKLAKWMNVARNDGLVNEDSYPQQSESYPPSGRFRRAVQRYTDGLEEAETSLDSIAMISSSYLGVVSEFADLKETKQTFENTLATESESLEDAWLDDKNNSQINPTTEPTRDDFTPN